MRCGEELSCYLHSGQARIILCSNCLADLHFLMQDRQKQWLQEGRIPNLQPAIHYHRRYISSANLASPLGLSSTTSMQIPQVFSLDLATAKESSMLFSCSWRQSAR